MCSYNYGGFTSIVNITDNQLLLARQSILALCKFCNEGLVRLRFLQLREENIT